VTANGAYELIATLLTIQQTVVGCGTRFAKEPPPPRTIMSLRKLILRRDIIIGGGIFLSRSVLHTLQLSFVFFCDVFIFFFLLLYIIIYICFVVCLMQCFRNIYYFVILFEVTMGRFRNGEGTARETLLAIQERRKNKNNAEKSGKQQIHQHRPATITKNSHRLPGTKRPPLLRHRQPKKKHHCLHPQVLQ
jgi:hypothetical protein